MTEEIRLAALCDHALVGQDGKVSLMGIFRNISVSGLPAQHPRMFLVAILGLEVGPHSVVVKLLRPDGQQAMPNPPEISVHAAAGQDVNVIVELNNMSFTTYGCTSSSSPSTATRSAIFRSPSCRCRLQGNAAARTRKTDPVRRRRQRCRTK